MGNSGGVHSSGNYRLRACGRGTISTCQFLLWRSARNVRWWFQDKNLLAGVPLQLLSSISLSLYRHLSDWLGSVSSGADGGQGVVSLGVRWAHKLFWKWELFWWLSYHSKKGSFIRPLCQWQTMLRLWLTSMNEGTKSRDLYQLMHEIFSWGETHMADLTAEYISGRWNILADQQSHH